MATRDSTFSYVHLDDPNQIIYMEKWEDDPIPFNDIDTQSLIEATTTLFPQYLLEEEEDSGLPISSSTFGTKVYKNRKLLKDKAWSDLAIFDKFMDESSSLHKQKDKTILKSVYTKLSNNAYESVDDPEEFTIAEFLSNGYNPSDTMDILSPPDMVNDSIMGNNAGDISINSTSDLLVPGNNTFSMNIRTNSGNNSNHQNAVMQTPRIGRSRQPSTDKIFQTPVTRIMR